MLYSSHFTQNLTHAFYVSLIKSKKKKLHWPFQHLMNGKINIFMTKLMFSLNIFTYIVIYSWLP